MAYILEKRNSDTVVLIVSYIISSVVKMFLFGILFPLKVYYTISFSFTWILVWQNERAHLTKNELFRLYAYLQQLEAGVLAYLEIFRCIKY